MQRFVFQQGIYWRYHRANGLSRRSFHIIRDHFTKGTAEEIQLTTKVPVACRKYLPGSNSDKFPHFLSGPKENYPVLLKVQHANDTSLREWGRRSREVVDEAFEKYEQDGTAVAVLFRGLPLRNENHLVEWGTGLGFDFVQYSKNGGNGLRENEVNENAMAGSEMEKAFTIELHNDMTYMAKYPKLFAISCFETAQAGGETAICDVRKIEAQLDPEFVKKLERKQIKYWQFLPDKNTAHEPELRKSWQEQYGTDNPDELARVLKDLGSGFEWDGTSLRSWQVLPPHIAHPMSGERLWFNQIGTHHRSFFQAMPVLEGVKLPDKRHPFYSHATYGNGEEIEDEFIEQVRSAAWKNAVGFQWQNGDVLFLDQLIMQHSRLSFEGNKRRVGIIAMDY